MNLCEKNGIITFRNYSLQQDRVIYKIVQLMKLRMTFEATSSIKYESIVENMGRSTSRVKVKKAWGNAIRDI